jgi:hypothetical protein
MLKTKTFDCVAMKRKGASRVYERIKDMTPKQELAYWKERSAQLDNRIKTAKHRKDI